MNRNLAYQEEPWQEVISGKVVMMSPRPAINHIRISGNLFQIFSTYLKGRRCEPFPDGTDLYLSEKNHFIPDFMIVCDPNKVKANAVYGAPDFVVEVLSLGSLKRDRFHKMAAYEKAGVQEYWIVRKTFTSAAASRNTGSSTPTAGRLNNTGWKMESLYCITPMGFIPTGCWKK